MAEYSKAKEVYRNVLADISLMVISDVGDVSALKDLVKNKVDLSNYFLMDLFCSSRTDTSYGSEAVNALEMMQFGALDNLEPNLHSLSVDDAKNREQFYSKYADWGGYQLLTETPECYLYPELRLNQTTIFQQFRSNLGVAKQDLDPINSSICAYVNKLDDILTLTPFKGYVSASKNHKIQNLVRVDLIALGLNDKTQVYRQYLEYDANLAATDTFQALWSEWAPLNVRLPANYIPSSLQNARCGGRDYLVWVEHTPPVKSYDPAPAPAPATLQDLNAASDDPPALVDTYIVKATYVNSAGAWIPAVTLSTIKITRTKNSQPNTADEDVLVVFYADTGDTSGKLVFCVNLDEADALSSGIILDQQLRRIFAETKDTNDTLVWYKTAIDNFEKSDDDFKNEKIESFQLCFCDESVDSVDHPLIVVHKAAEDSNTVEPEASGLILAPLQYEISFHPTGPTSTSGTLSIKLSSPHQGIDPATRWVFNVGFGKPDGPYKKYDYTEVMHTPPTGEIKIDFSLHLGVDCEVMLVVVGQIEDGIQPIKVVWGAIRYYDFSYTERSKNIETSPVIMMAKSDTDVSNSFNPVYLKFRAPAPKAPAAPLSPVRLNSYFSKSIADLAAVDIPLFFSNKTQASYVEPDFPGSKSNKLDLTASNALCNYFWELYFHMPMAIAAYLLDKGEYLECRSWIKYVFDPASGWQFLPFVTGDSGQYQGMARDDIDPFELAKTRLFHLKIWVQRFYIETLQMQAESLYQQLTPDTVVHAAQLYLRALAFLGPTPAVSHYVPESVPTIGTASVAVTEHLTALEREIGPSLAPHPVVTRFLALSDASGFFTKPLNPLKLELWTKCQSALSNMENGLTLDGLPMNIGLFAKITDPLSLLIRENTGGYANDDTQAVSGAVSQLRFRAIANLAQQMIDNLQSLAADLQNSSSQSDDRSNNVLFTKLLLQTQQANVQTQSNLLLAAQASLAATSSNYQRALDRKKTYAPNLADHQSKLHSIEISQIVGHTAQETFSAISQALMTLAGVVKSGTPDNVFWIPNAAAEVSAQAAVWQVSGDWLRETVDSLQMLNQWSMEKIQLDDQIAQMDVDVEVLAQEVNAQTAQVDAATAALQQAQQEYSNTQQQITVLQQMSNSADMYEWLNGRLSKLYAKCVRAANAVCIAAQNSYAFETGDSSSTGFETNVFDAEAFGYSAPSVLRSNLMQLIAKRYALGQAEGEGRIVINVLDLARHSDPSESADAYYRRIFGDPTEMRGEGVMHFSITERMLDTLFPGQYNRKIKSVGLRIESTNAATQTTGGAFFTPVLEQTASYAICSPDRDTISALLDVPADSGTLLDYINSGKITFSTSPVPMYLGGYVPRSLSDANSGSPDPTYFDYGTYGTPAEGGDQYAPFERTGVISSFALDFRAMLKGIKVLPDRSVFYSGDNFTHTITNISMEITYFYKYRDSSFRQEVLDLLYPSATQALHSAVVTAVKNKDRGFFERIAALFRQSNQE